MEKQKEKEKSIKCIIPMKLNNWNDIINDCRRNKFSANSHKQKEMKDIAYFIRKIPKIEEYPIRVIFKWHIKSKVSDLDNKSVKSILDCMQSLGILENDNVKYIREIIYIAEIDKEDYVEMEIEKC